MSNIKRIQDFKDSWDMFRIYLSDTSWREKYKICFIQSYNEIIQQLNIYYPMCYTLENMFSSKNHSIIYGHQEDGNFYANMTCFDFENKTDLKLFGNIIGLCIYNEELIIDSKILIYLLRFMKLFKLQKNIVVLVRNCKEIEGYIINPQLIELYNSGLIDTSTIDKQSKKISFKKEMEVFQNKCKYATKLKNIDIELFYHPISLVKINSK